MRRKSSLLAALPTYLCVGEGTVIPAGREHSLFVSLFIALPLNKTCGHVKSVPVACSVANVQTGELLKVLLDAQHTTLDFETDLFYDSMCFSCTGVHVFGFSSSVYPCMFVYIYIYIYIYTQYYTHI